MNIQSFDMHMKNGESIRIPFRTIRELSSISSFIILVIFSFFNIVTIVYIQSQFDDSPTMIAYKEIAEDCYPSAICDEEGRIHVVWQSDRKGNWDVYHTLLDDQIQRREFNILTTESRDDLFPSLSMDEKGNIWVVWIRTGSDETLKSSGSSIWYRTFESQTSTWSKETHITTDDFEKKSPSLISVDSNRMLVAWISEEDIQKIKYSVLQDGHPEKIGEISDAINVRKITLGKTKDGKIFALWNSMSLEKNCLFFSFYEHEDFSMPESLGEEFNGYNPSIVIRKDEPSMLFLRDEYYNIFYSVESNNSVSDFPTFSEPEVICKTGALEDCPVAVETTEGEVYLFWTSTYTGDNEIFFCHSSHADDFQKGIDYASDLESPEKIEQFVKNLTRDPSQHNSNTDGYFCADIFFSAAIVKGELWLVWDSYSWDSSAENGNVRKIKYMKSSDGHCWEKPFILMDNSISEYGGKDDRHPAIVETEDGYIWLFWHTDRYEGTYDICYIKFRLTNNGEPPRNIQNETPERLTDSPKNDSHPAAVSLGNRVYVVWQSDRNGNLDIFLKWHDGEKWTVTVPATDQKTPESCPSIAAYKGWHLKNLFHSEHLMVSWDSLEKDKFSIYFADLVKDGKIQISKPENRIQLPTSRALSVQSPDIYYISRHTLISKIFQKNPWFVWQSSEIASSVTNIQCNEGISKSGVIEETQITDDLSRNASPEIVEFDGKTWIFWDSNGGGNGRGIYYRYLYRRSIPLWLWTYSFLLATLWVLFLLDVRSGGGMKRFALQFCKWIDEWFKNHTWYASIIIGVITGLLTYVILQFLGRLL